MLRKAYFIKEPNNGIVQQNDYSRKQAHTQALSLEMFLSRASDGKCRKRARDKRRAKAEAAAPCHAADVDK